MEMLHNAHQRPISYHSLDGTFSAPVEGTFFQLCFPQVNLTQLKNQRILSFEEEGANSNKTEDNFQHDDDVGARRGLLTQTFVKFFSQNPVVQENNCKIFPKSSDEENNRPYGEAENTEQLNICGVQSVNKSVLQDINRSYKLKSSRSKRSRGRPKKEDIPLLICEGSLSESNIKCPLCARVFPFAKGLKTHLSTHSGEKSILCDYPGCLKAFRQTGQLDNHIRTHTKEKPFYCPEAGCCTQHAHSNRECPHHPKAKLRRKQETTEVLLERIPKHHRQEERKWIEEYLKKRDLKMKQNQKKRFKDGVDKADSQDGLQEEQMDGLDSAKVQSPNFHQGSSPAENLTHESDDSESEATREAAQILFLFAQTVKAHHADMTQNSSKELFNEALKHLQ